MIVIQTRHLPLPHRFYAINILGIVIARGPLDAVSHRHEYIHTLQQRELLFVGFYLLYVIEWLIRFVQHRSAYRGYLNISFEREAYDNAGKTGYERDRRHYAWVKYLFI